LISNCVHNPFGSVRDSEQDLESYLNGNPIIKDNIEYYMQTDKSVYKLGEIVKMLYRITNLRGEDVKFTSPCSPVWNFWVEKDEKVIWKAVNGWWTVITEFTISPNNSKEFTYFWNMSNDKGNLVNAGKYNSIDGLYPSLPHDNPTTVSVSIEIIQ